MQKSSAHLEELLPLQTSDRLEGVMGQLAQPPRETCSGFSFTPLQASEARDCKAAVCPCAEALPLQKSLQIRGMSPAAFSSQQCGTSPCSAQGPRTSGDDAPSGTSRLTRPSTSALTPWGTFVTLPSAITVGWLPSSLDFSNTKRPMSRAIIYKALGVVPSAPGSVSAWRRIHTVPSQIHSENPVVRSI